VPENLNDGLYHVVPIEGAYGYTWRWKVIGPGQDGSSVHDMFYEKENAEYRVAWLNKDLAERTLCE